jgi:aspartyl protease family protein
MPRALQPLDIKLIDPITSAFSAANPVLNVVRSQWLSRQCCPSAIPFEMNRQQQDAAIICIQGYGSKLKDIGGGLMFETKRFVLRLVAGLGLVLPLSGVGFAQSSDSGADVIAKSLERFGLQVPRSIAERDPLRKQLEELGREPCDQKAIMTLGQALDREGYRREGAAAHIRFSQLCGGYAPSLRAAANLLLNLSDYAGAASVASELITTEPYRDNGYYLRALADEKLGQYRKAIDDYSTAIELFGDKSHISSVGYEGLARAYDKVGRPCDAAASIETWVSANPARRETSQSRSMIRSYQMKGSCRESSSPKEEVFVVSRPNNSVTLHVAVNGVVGNFILDTGATFVAMKASFAQRAKVEIDLDSSLKLNTANGIVDAKGGLARSIQLRSLRALDVSVVVQQDIKGLYGPNIDGLLGMSFLSRSRVVIDGNTVKVKNANAS